MSKTAYELVDIPGIAMKGKMDCYGDEFIYAKYIEKKVTIHNSLGEIEVPKGHYVLRLPNGKLHAMNQDRFKSSFKRVN